MQAKNIVIALLGLAIIGAVVYLLLNNNPDVTVVVDKTSDTATEEQLPSEGDTKMEDATTTPVVESAPERGSETVLGTSVGGKEIVAYHFGSGEKEVLFVGGVHSGYSPNTTALANDLVSYFKDNPAAIPNNVLVTIVPNLNPDGAAKSGAAGRFNADNVDLNRNFDCQWSAEGVWKDQKVSGGDAAFSEPEAKALRDYILTNKPAAAVVWFGAEGKVYPSACNTTPSKDSVTLAATFAAAAGYPAAAKFDAYPVTGDMVNWMAKEGIPAISVLLTDHQNTEWNKNLAGVQAILKAYAE